MEICAAIEPSHLKIIATLIVRNPYMQRLVQIPHKMNQHLQIKAFFRLRCLLVLQYLYTFFDSHNNIPFIIFWILLVILSKRKINIMPRSKGIIPTVAFYFISKRADESKRMP